MFRNLKISQKLNGVIILLIICIGALGAVSWIMLNRVAEINDQAKEALAHVAMLDELEIAHLDWALHSSQIRSAPLLASSPRLRNRLTC